MRFSKIAISLIAFLALAGSALTYSLWLTSTPALAQLLTERLKLCLDISNSERRLECTRKAVEADEAGKSEDACAVLAAYATSPGTAWPKDYEEKARLCGLNPNKITCNDTAAFIAQRKKVPRNVLTCTGGG